MNSQSVMRGQLIDFGPLGCPCCKPASVHFAGTEISSVIDDDTAPNTTLLMPVLANAHDHLRGIKPISLGAFDLPLELWLTAMSNIPKPDPYLVAATALGRQALGGIGTIMIHYTRPNDANALPVELQSVARAAQDIGVRVAIAVSMRDRNPLGYGPDEQILEGLDPSDQAKISEKLIPSMRSPAEQMRLVEALAEQLESPLVSVQYGPYGMEWCSDGLLEQIARRSAETGRRVHMHLLESGLQREYLDHLHEGQPIRHLDDLGLLSERLSVAHGVWLREDEMELLAARGVTLSTNASSNLSLRSGRPPVAEMVRRQMKLAIGMDGFSFDDDDDGFREIRLNYLLHKGTGLEGGLPLGTLLRAACYGGRHSVAGLAPGSGVAAGAPGDLMALDYGAISSDILMPADPVNVLVHRATSRILTRMVVAGRTVVEDGRLTGIDLSGARAEMDAQVRHGLGAYQAWRQVSDKLGARLRNFYQAGFHRCG
ncbi:Cytosine/adenosine deaminase [Arboricoccus pini]|uniref:Cytosine/adenosine deaminase n=1 Tax=Arboricoccus pini TaxID=1963835 RepID=A0A212RYC1_9PROT|nr:amidohydrolase family protein [Arboricoccus pini]SNB77753.1 Cytosine/adenosine deaminase [Arboricoccus pini]